MRAFYQRMFTRARLEQAVVRAAENLVDTWESPDPLANFGVPEHDLIDAIHAYRDGVR